jgi:Bacterial pre-peptidase C-terminal domain
VARANVPALSDFGFRPSFGLRISAFGFLFAATFLFCCAAPAASPHLADISPTGGQRGTELALRFKGERLEDAEEVLCYEPGIEVLKLNTVTNKLVEAKVKIAADCALGEHHLRLRTASGVSELRTFLVGPFPVEAEVEPNNDAAHAQHITLNATVTGVIQNEDVDCFSVEATKGQRLSAEVEGMRLGRGVFDPRLIVQDASGKVLADVDDTWLAMQDPFVSFVAPHDGKYIVQLREVTYGGSDDCDYRLHVGTFPRPVSVFPLGGQAGQNVVFTFYSEATGSFTNAIKLPASPQEKFGVFASLDGQPAPTPNWIRVSTFPNILANDSNHDRQHAATAAIAPPMAFNGILARKDQEDWFRFRAAKGQPLVVSAYARRLRSPLDSVIEVFDANGHSLASNDDADGVDSELKFTPSETTNYFVRIRDTLGQGGPDFTYRLEVTHAAPRLTVKIPEVSRNDTQSRQWIAVPRGNRVATLVSVKRANYQADVRFRIDGLPPGVTMLADALPSGIDAMPVVFEAAPDAPIGGKLLDLEAVGTTATGPIHGLFHQEVELVDGPNNTSYYITGVDKLCVAVVKEAPFKLHIVEPQVPLVQAGSMQLEVAVERAPGFDEPIELQMLWNPPGVSSQSEATIPKGATNITYQLNAGGSAEAKRWKITVLGHATIDGGAIYASSQPAELNVASPFLSGKIETAWVNPGHPGKLVVDLQQTRRFEGKAAIRLCGLPEKVSAPERQISADDKEVQFDLTVDPKCPTGPCRNLFCAVDVKQNGQVIPHTIATGGVLRVVPPKKNTEMTKADQAAPRN